MLWWIYMVVAVLAIASQGLFLWQSRRNYFYALKKSACRHPEVRQPVLLTVPCKGIDSAFDKNIRSLFALEYPNFVLHLVVEDASDPAYEVLCRLRDELAAGSAARQVHILTAGRAAGCSQKIHNLLHSVERAGADVEVLAFADSDACLPVDWLQHLVYPLRKERHGATTGYRWFVPVENNMASLALSAINGKLAQMLGNTDFNQLWGGSMAVRAETARKIDLASVWGKAISDDLSLSHAVKAAGMKIMFAPRCMVASHEKTTWARLFEFARRQFVIARITTPRTWWFGVFCITYSLCGVWGGGAIAAYAAVAKPILFPLYAVVPVLFAGGQIYRSMLRQRMIMQLLPEEAARLKATAIADTVGTFFWSWLLFVFIAASAFGRTITWRGIRYKLLGPYETVIVSK
ncbi:MAG: glycosyltransferase [Phycisphaerae bacterium]|nr:glycosyltransferase [Phycisphaerae bacterium]